MKFAETLISGMLPFVVLIFCGAYLTLKSRFFFLRLLPESVKYALGGIFKKNKKDGVSPFQAACTALSATVGTGNIAGVAGAVALGGAGAVFWMWVSAFAGMAVKTAEIICALKFRESENDGFAGGPMYYIKNGLPKIFMPLAALFSFTGLFSVFCSGNLTQTNAAVASVGDSFSVKLIFGILFAVITGFVMIGGARRIGIFTEKTVPIMALIYILMSFGIIFAHIRLLPTAFRMIFKGAFTPSAVTGGAVGSFVTTVLEGASKGVFSNEAGLGTSAMAHSASEYTDGIKQSLYGIFEVFADTVVICTLTALTILCSGVNIEYGKIASTELVNTALSTLYGKASDVLLAVMMCLFGLSSVIGWGFYGTVCSEFIFGSCGKRIFTAVYPFFCIAGAIINADAAWRLSAFFNGIMLTVNVFAVLLLSGEVLKEIEEFSIISNKKRKKK